MTMNREDDFFTSWRAQATTMEPYRLLEAVCAREARLARRAERRNFLEYVGAAIGLATSLLYAVLFDQITLRLACLLLATTLIPYGLTLHRHGRVAEAPPATASVDVHLAYYRSELAREHALFPRMRWYWVPLVASFELFALAGVQALRAYSETDTGTNALLVAVPIVLFAGAFAYNLRTHRKLAREIAALDARP
jgi:hypothetical protein